MKEHAALVIAAIMVTSMAFAASTTTVSVSSAFSASPGATVLPSYARAGTRIKFTVTVTNDYATDNIDNVVIKATSAFVQPIGYADNLKLAAENIENAVPFISQAGENLKLAEDNKKSSGPNIKAAGDNLQAPAQDDWRAAAYVGAGSSAAADNAWIRVENAGSKLLYVADAIDNQIENLDYIRTYLRGAGDDLVAAAGVAGGNATNIENFDPDGADNVRFAGENLRFAADNLWQGDLETAGLRLLDAAANLSSAGASLADLDPELAAIGTAGSALTTAGNKLVDAGNFLDNAGYALGMAENYLTSAGVLLATVSNLGTAGANLKIAASLIENAGIAIGDNVLRAGENLKLASDNLESVAVELGVDLGKDGENAAAVDIDQAAENLRTRGAVDITTAGDELKSAATNLATGASVMKSTATDLKPTTWTLIALTDGVRFDAIGDNVIKPGNTETFVFLWTTPSIATETDYTISVLVSKKEVTYTAYENYGGFTLRVDGKAPTLTINVTQAGVATTNVVGNKLDNARATITIVASEVLSSLGEVRVENSGQDENLLPPISGTAFTTADNITYTYQYITIGEWDDNSVAVRVVSAKDRAGNENSAGMENIITVDTERRSLSTTAYKGSSRACARTSRRREPEPSTATWTTARARTWS